MVLALASAAGTTGTSVAMATKILGWGFRGEDERELTDERE